MNIESLYKRFKESNTISTDTRKLPKDCMYFALKGANFDGNKFVKQALDNGAKYCIVDHSTAVINAQCILVKDVLATLQNLATYHRKQINIPIIALTGSNGKTTTKELIYTVLSTQYKVGATKGNLNNHIGVPLTLLSFTDQLDFGIVEMGANHLKEIEFLSKIAMPDYGLITNFGKAHLEGFGSLEGVVKGKSELYDHLKTNHKTVFINNEDETQIQQISDYSKVITFGSGLENDCIVKFKNANPLVSINYKETEINSQLIGTYNFGNIAVAIAIGQHFKITTKHIKQAIESYKPDNNRSEIIEKKSNKIILDAYNANPTSMFAALSNFNQLNEKPKYLFLGDMFELGKNSKEEHQAIVDYLQANFENNVFIIGENFFKTSTNDSIKKYLNFEELKLDFSKLTIKEATILIKGSRGMALERLLNLL